MRFTERVYEAGLSVVRPVADLLLRSGRARKAIEGRRESVARFREWALHHRDRSLPLVWMHAPSVGEALMAQAIIAELRSRLPCQVAFTWFSPSAERMESRIGADVAAYLPWDVRADVRASLDVLVPRGVVFVRTEIWPTLVREAHARGAATLLVNAPLAETSTRLRWYARSFLGSAYARLDAVAAVGTGDAERFTRLGVPPRRVHVAGDARFDQAWARARAVDPDSALLRRLSDDGIPVIVAGSTWPADESVLIPAWETIRRERRVRLVIAPHEPSPAALDALESRLRQPGVSIGRLGTIEKSAEAVPDIVIVDRTGVLAELYACARAAYVGGGFGSDGLHSVVEPAALGVPVVFGPRTGNAREALDLAAAGGGAVARNSEAIAASLAAWLGDATAGSMARGFVESRLGGAAANADVIVETLNARIHAGGGGSDS